MTPLPLLWQILTSFPRLMTQLWPTLVWALFQFSGAGVDDDRLADPMIPSLTSS